MEVVDTAQINTFGTTSPKADFVQPAREQVITLTSGQLRTLIQESLMPLRDEIDRLDGIITRQNEIIDDLRKENENLSENQLIQLRLINDLREAAKKEPQPMQRDRGDILRALLAANGGKMLATDARRKMHLSRSRFSELLAMVKDEIEARPYHLNKSWQVLVLR